MILLMLSELVKHNYNEILLRAIRITRRRNRRQAEALINEAYLTLSGKDEVPDDNQRFIEHFAKTMKFLYIGGRSSYNKAEKPSPNYLEYDPGNDDWKDIELMTEGINDQTKDAILNLSHLTYDKALKYSDLMQFKNILPPHEKEIFDLHFEKGLSCRDIVKLMEIETGWKMGKTRINEMIQEVKRKIYERC